MICLYVTKSLCKIVYQTKTTMDNLTIKTYNKLAQEYDEETISFWERFPDTIISTFAESVGEGGTVLYLGSGPGQEALMSKAN